MYQSTYFKLEPNDKIHIVDMKNATMDTITVETKHLPDYFPANDPIFAINETQYFILENYFEPTGIAHSLAKLKEGESNFVLDSEVIFSTEQNDALQYLNAAHQTKIIRDKIQNFNKGSFENAKEVYFEEKMQEIENIAIKYKLNKNWLKEIAQWQE